MAVPQPGIALTPEGAKRFIAADEEIVWQQKMFREFDAGNSHSFILYFNIHDFVFVPSFAQPKYFPQRLKDYVGSLLSSRGFNIVIYYSRARGFRFLDPAMQDCVNDWFPADIQSKLRDYGSRPIDHPNQFSVVAPIDEVEVALSYIDRLLSYKPARVKGKAKEGEEKVIEPPRIAVILEYLETLAPHEDSRNPSPSANFSIQMLHQWTSDRRMVSSKHIIIGLAADLGHVASTLYASGSDCVAYQVGFPVEDSNPASTDISSSHQRREWLKWVFQKLPDIHLANPLDPNNKDLGNVDQLAANTSGFNYDSLRDLVLYTASSHIPLDSAMIQERKRDIITAESRELLEIVTPQHGFDGVAGYKYIKDFMEMIHLAIVNRGKDPFISRMVPKGVLFLGPPGTGKSFMAAALASETNFNMVKLRNIRSMYVGETERNLNRVLDLLSNLEPVIVFVDEVDAALGKRGTSEGSDGGSKVEQHVFQRILEFMAMDEYRGRILWVAASNRPDSIDAALLSRFDIVMPFLLPDFETRKTMFVTALPKKIEYDFSIESEEKLAELVQATQGFSGRELDTIARRALQMVAEDRVKQLANGEGANLGKPCVSTANLERAMVDFRQARDLEEYELQTLLAIQNTNFISFLPSREELPESIRSSVGSSSPIDEKKLQARIQELRGRQQRRGCPLGLS